MKRLRFTEEQIVRVLKEAASGKKVDVCRQYSVSDATFYTWCKKYGGLEVSKLKRLKQLEFDRKSWILLSAVLNFGL